MKKAALIILTAVVAILFASPVTAQQKELPPNLNPELPLMSSYDSLMLSQLPELEMPSTITKRLLPSVVDNSQLPWFRPLIAQVGLECGQASSIGLMFTYEIDFLRQAPANLPHNQFATHFAYNFVNGGADAGVNYYETFEILKRAGTPSVWDYGGMSIGGPSRWMSGYTEYYNAMHNRVTEIYTIKVNTPEGLQTLKNWIFDHGNGSQAGGLACFYAQFSNPPLTLPQGTPEAGKHVITSWGSSANHSMTICGFNDSIRWDYNGDGLYTNDTDINGDGVVDMRDWEIGGFKMANTYGSISGWGDQGFSYMMYKSVADQFQQGGIWNNAVVVIDVRDNHLPQLTAKVNMSHTCRSLLKVTAGVSANPQASEPDHILQFPIFDFQGGCHPMQGNTYPENLEFGLDLNPLLTFVEPGAEARYFLMIEENDPLQTASGMLTSFALVDYTNGTTQIDCPVSGIPLTGNGITKLSINAAINYDAVAILTDTLPSLQLYANYNVQLQAEGGTPPYRWHIAEDYLRHDSTATMPQITQQKLVLSNNSNGSAAVNLPFIFPYFGKEYNHVYATSDGYLIFENTLLPWPFYIEGRTYFLQKPMIAPCMSNPFLIDNGQGDGVWYEDTGDHVTFRWKLSISQVTGGTVNATARLYPDGTIEFTYGDFVSPAYIERWAGISAGDGENYTLLDYNPDFTPGTNQFIRFSPLRLHKGIQLNSSGILSGIASVLFDNQPVKICATDKNNIRAYRTLHLKTEGLQMEYTVTAGTDTIIEYGETCTMSLTVTNHNPSETGPVTLSLTTLDPRYTITSANAYTPVIQPGETVYIDDAFTFNASVNIQNEHLSTFIIAAQAAGGNWSRQARLMAYRPVISISGLEIYDGNNGILEPGENALLRLSLTNAGGAKLRNALATLSTWDPYLQISGTAQTHDTLLPDETWLATYMVALSHETPLNHMVQANLNVTGDNQFNYLKTIPLLTGIIVEDFELGNFSSYEWQTGGNAAWVIMDGHSWEGNHSAKSGVITDNQTSNLWIDWDVAFADSISFWFKVSSEANYDYLRFLSNGVELGKWAGQVDWRKAGFLLPAGPTTLSWRYTKDYSVSNGDDCAYLDYIIFPAYAIATANSGQFDLFSNFTVYPNPTAGEINLSWTLRRPSAVQVLITDEMGRILYLHDMPGILPAGAHHFRPAGMEGSRGTWMVMLRTAEGTLVKKLIRTGNR